MNVTTKAKPAVLKEIVSAASHALSHLDAERLEELALSCAALNRDIPRASLAERAEILTQLRTAMPQMVILARLIDVTRANLDVIHRLREMRLGHTGYENGVKCSWESLENLHGLN